MNILALAEQYGDQLKEIMRDLHEHPELSYKEFRTTEIIRKFCAELGMQFIDMNLPTGIVAVLDSGKPGKNVSLRADIDALPRKNPLPGEYGNAFHGCGHDFHTTALLGAAKILKQQDFSGSISFIFQLAEEATSGARTLMEHGLFEKLPQPISALFGFHNLPLLPSGVIGVREGAVMSAKVNFEIRIIGKAGHAGEPHNSIDPIVASAAFIQSVQTISSRNIDPLDSIACSICTIRGGVIDNRIPEDVTMAGSIRALRDETVAYAEDRLRTILRSTCEAYGCTGELQIHAKLPSVFNSAEMTALARKAAARITDPAHIIEQPPSIASEDFALLGHSVPSFFYMIGSGGAHGNMPGWHNNNFVADDSPLPLAAAVLAQSALTALE